MNKNIPHPIEFTKLRPIALYIEYSTDSNKENKEFKIKKTTIIPIVNFKTSPF